MTLTEMVQRELDMRWLTRRQLARIVLADEEEIQPILDRLVADDLADVYPALTERDTTRWIGIHHWEGTT